MELEGRLDAFGLPDILHLLAFTAKTGALHVRRAAQPTSASAVGVVHLRNGAITAASSDVTRQELARRVVAAGLVDDDALRAGVHRVRADPSLGLVQVLVEAGAVSAAAACRVAREQVVDALSELLRWEQGQFSFALDVPDRDGLPVTLAVDEVVSEGRRRLEAWPALTALIPSPAAVLSLSVNPPAEPCCSREEWGLLALVDGRRSVSEVVALLGRAEYGVVRALAGLVERGLLVSADDGSNGVLADLVRRQAILAEIEPATGIEPASGPSRQAFVGTPSPQLPAEPVIEPATGPATEPIPALTTLPVPDQATQQRRDDALTAGLLTATAATTGAVALDPTAAARPAADTEPAADTKPAADPETQDSIVTKSLVLRLIAGVRGL